MDTQDPDIYAPEFRACKTGVKCSDQTVVGAVTVRYSPEQLIENNTSPVLASLPGSPRNPDGDTLIEEVVSAPTQKMLELVAATSQMIAEGVFNILPDFVSADANLPLIGGVNLAITKDLEVFGGYNLFGISGGNLEGATRENINWRVSYQGGFGYFLTTDRLSGSQRFDLMEGVDLNISIRNATVVNQLDGAGPPALVVGYPGGAGVSTSQSRHLFSLRPLVGRDPIR